MLRHIIPVFTSCGLKWLPNRSEHELGTRIAEAVLLVESINSITKLHEAQRCVGLGLPPLSGFQSFLKSFLWFCDWSSK